MDARFPLKCDMPDVSAGIRPRLHFYCAMADGKPVPTFPAIAFGTAMEPALGLDPRNASIGRYIQPRLTSLRLSGEVIPDPLGLIDGPSRYAYAGSSPLMYTDPRGEAAFVIPVIAGEKGLEALLGLGIGLGAGQMLSDWLKQPEPIVTPQPPVGICELGGAPVYMSRAASDPLGSKRSFDVSTLNHDLCLLLGYSL